MSGAGPRPGGRLALFQIGIGALFMAFGFASGLISGRWLNIVPGALFLRQGITTRYPERVPKWANFAADDRPCLFSALFMAALIAIALLIVVDAVAVRDH